MSSLLQLQAKTAGDAEPLFRDAAARIGAIAGVHKQLHKADYAGTVQLDLYRSDLCHEIGTASGIPGRGWTLIVDAFPLTVTKHIAVPLGLIVNELLTNAIQHARPGVEGEAIHIAVSGNADEFSVSVTDPGNGPAPRIRRPAWERALSTPWFVNSMRRLRSETSSQAVPSP